MLNLWNTKGQIEANVIDPAEKTFMFRFETERDKVKVMEGQPWHFERYVWCFNKPCPHEKLSDISLFHVPLWVRVYDLPLAGRANEENAKVMGDLLGVYVGRDTEGDLTLNRAVRIRVLHDVRKPIKKEIRIILLSGKKSSFQVKYERLPIFCYGCGLMGHGKKDCELGPYEEGTLPFDAGITASPWKSIKQEFDGGKKVACRLESRFVDERQEEQIMIDRLIAKFQSVALRKHKSNITPGSENNRNLVEEGAVIPQHPMGALPVETPIGRERADETKGGDGGEIDTPGIV
ncbi:hypothetical protein vseg_010483 [Gypsophila vaccaria]